MLSPSFAAPGAFPAVHELAMRRLAEEFGVEPVEYPTTRQVGAPTRARAADLMAAFADPGIGAVLASIGGDDQLTVQRRLRRFLLLSHQSHGKTKIVDSCIHPRVYNYPLSCDRTWERITSCCYLMSALGDACLG